MATTKKATAIRLTDEGTRLLAAVADQLGVSRTAVMEMAIRRIAKEEGVASPPAGEGEGGA
jgi:predicted transcriptional regulator